MDALSEALNAVRMTGAIFYHAECTAPWGFRVPHVRDVAHVLAPGTERLVSYHLVTEGKAVVRFPEVSIPVSAGDVLIIPHGDAHTVSNGSPAKLVESGATLGRYLAGDLTTMRLGGGGAMTRFVCGYFGCERHADRLFLAGLPLMIRVSIRGDPAGEWLESSICHLVSEAGSGRPGQSVLLSKMAEALFIETLRRYMEQLPAEQTGWLAGARDAVVGAALALMHRKPFHPWTIAELAVEAGTSRSVLADRFALYLGEPPLAYLGRWRLQLAARLLETTRKTVLQVASEVGYESEAAFNRAFKRQFGAPPGQFRKRQPDSGFAEHERPTPLLCRVNLSFPATSAIVLARPVAGLIIRRRRHLMTTFPSCPKDAMLRSRPDVVSLQPIRDLDVVGLDGQPAFASGASGLVRAGAFFHVISDDALCLASFPVASLRPGTLTRIADGELPLAPGDRKARKPDFEVLLALPPTSERRFGSLLALGSGSRPNRRRGVRIALGERGEPVASESLDLAPLFAAFDGAFAETNIEGAVIIGPDLLLFQRGNAGSPVNAIIELPWTETLAAIETAVAAPRPLVREVDLGMIDGTPLAFTDATLAGRRILFSAVAERTANAYDDGEVAGSAIGLVDRNGRVERLSMLSPAAKVEGIEAELIDGRLQIALVNDADDPSRPSQLFAATMTIKGQED